MKPQVFTRQETGGMRRGTWRNAGGGPPWLCCPLCGGVGRLDDGHAITSDGLVTPSVACHAAGCGFHAEIRLEGWEG